MTEPGTLKPARRGALAVDVYRRASYEARRGHSELGLRQTATVKGAQSNRERNLPGSARLMVELGGGAVLTQIGWGHFEADYSVLAQY